jgi:hypothetical protein
VAVETPIVYLTSAEVGSYPTILTVSRAFLSMRKRKNVSRQVFVRLVAIYRLTEPKGI